MRNRGHWIDMPFGFNCSVCGHNVDTKQDICPECGAVMDGLSSIRMVVDKGACMPVRGHADDAGLDIRTPEAFTLKAHGDHEIATGIHVEIPKGYYGKLESKSGLNVNYSVVSLGGVIDSGFTGQIIAKLYSMSDEDYHFNAGDKCIQMIIQPCETPEIEIVDSLEETERGNSGFGSTGR